MELPKELQTEIVSYFPLEDAKRLAQKFPYLEWILDDIYTLTKMPVDPFILKRIVCGIRELQHGKKARKKLLRLVNSFGLNVSNSRPWKNQRCIPETNNQGFLKELGKQYPEMFKFVLFNLIDFREIPTEYAFYSHLDYCLRWRKVPLIYYKAQLDYIYETKGSPNTFSCESLVRAPCILRRRDQRWYSIHSGKKGWKKISGNELKPEVVLSDEMMRIYYQEHMDWLYRTGEARARFSHVLREIEGDSTPIIDPMTEPCPLDRWLAILDEPVAVESDAFESTNLCAEVQA